MSRAAAVAHLLEGLAVGALACACGPPKLTPLGNPPYDAVVVARLADLDGDGVDEFAVAEPLRKTDAGRGEVLVFSGRGGRQLLTLRCAGEHLEFGHALASGADANGDGVPEILVAAPEPFGEDGGHIELRSGADGHLLARSPRIEGTDWVGDGLCSIPDANGDGIADVVVGAGRRGRKGATGVLLLLSGRDLSPIQGARRALESRVGSLVLLDDVDGDGARDLAVATIDDRVRTVSVPSLEVVWEREGRAGAGFGWWPIASVSDTCGDGVGDLLVTVWHDDPPRIELLSGATGEVIRSVLGRPEHPHRPPPGTPGAYSDPGDAHGFARAVAGLGDLDGDGVPDLAVGAPGYPYQVSYFGLPMGVKRSRLGPEQRRGRVILYSGATGEELRTVESDRDYDWFGSSLARVDDFDGDGLDDLLVGTGAGFSARAAVVSLATGTVLWRLGEAR